MRWGAENGVHSQGPPLVPPVDETAEPPLDDPPLPADVPPVSVPGAPPALSIDAPPAAAPPCASDWLLSVKGSADGPSPASNPSYNNWGQPVMRWQATSTAASSSQRERCWNRSAGMAIARRLRATRPALHFRVAHRSSPPSLPERRKCVEIDRRFVTSPDSTHRCWGTYLERMTCDDASLCGSATSRAGVACRRRAATHRVGRRRTGKPRATATKKTSLSWRPGPVPLSHRLHYQASQRKEL